MRRFRPVLLASCLALSAVQGFAQTDTDPGAVFRAVSAPDASGLRPTQISWSHDSRLAFFWDEGGDTLWWMNPARGTREVFFRTADLARLNGTADFEVDEYVWAPKDPTVALVAGGDLYLYSLEGRDLRRLTRTPDEESDPKFSPDGSRLAFVRDYDLFVLDLATGRERALTTDGTGDTFINGATDWVYWEEIWGRDSTGFWWSPDGGKIAYYRFDERPVGTYPITDLAKLDPTVRDQKYPRPGEANPIVRVGVLDLGSGKTTWMQTGEEDSYLARVAWSPAGEVAIQKLSRDQAKLELLRCGADDGRCAPLVSESWPTWINLGPGFEYLPDGRFLWGSEESGWNRLYLHDKDGKRLRAVTPEGWNVTSLDAVTPDGLVVFTGFRTGTLGATERHVLRARLT
ncbi:MAG TPA: DPP IV N-terminal domain-containing protein, partial [Thermoanaerobaculia bacterium]|nr:DPP IV N-terminal domain-containing protein [Thermoanaerobaculia bacterium]